MTMYLVCSVDIWHSQYLWCFSLWPSQVKRFIYEDTFMQDFILVHFAEIVYSNKKPTMKTVLKGFTGDGREILFLPVFAKPLTFATLLCWGRSVCPALSMSQCPTTWSTDAAPISSHTFGSHLLCPRPPSGRSLPLPTLSYNQCICFT